MHRLSRRFRRGCLAAALALLASVSVADAAAPATRATRATAESCLNEAFGIHGPTAVSTEGPSAALTSRLSVLARPAQASDAYDATPSLVTAVHSQGAGTVDVSGSRLLSSTAAGDDVYIVPVTLGAPTLSRQCARIKALAGISALVKSRRAQAGSGPGVCLLDTETDGTGSQAQHDLTGGTCLSTARLGGYLAMVSDGVLDGLQDAVLVPDDVSSVVFSYADGRRRTVAASHNLVALRASVQNVDVASPTRLATALKADLPTSVSELDSGGQTIRTLARPRDAVSLYVGEIEFLARLDAA